MAKGKAPRRQARGRRQQERRVARAREKRGGAEQPRARPLDTILSWLLLFSIVLSGGLYLYHHPLGAVGVAEWLKAIGSAAMSGG